MKLSTSVKPISYLKAHASRLIRDLSSHQGTLIVTHNGQAKAVLQDIHTFEQTQETLALLKILTRSQRRGRKVGTGRIKLRFWIQFVSLFLHEWGSRPRLQQNVRRGKVKSLDATFASLGQRIRGFKNEKA
jgi:prevent-host-death family protein